MIDIERVYAVIYRNSLENMKLKDLIRFDALYQLIKVLKEIIWVNKGLHQCFFLIIKFTGQAQFNTFQFNQFYQVNLVAIQTETSSLIITS